MSESETRPGWSDAACDMCGILADAPWVIGLRLRRLARGGAAAGDELGLMVAEKWYANKGVASAIATGRMGRSPREIAANVIGFYGQWVSDNRRRLSAGERAGGIAGESF